MSDRRSQTRSRRVGLVVGVGRPTWGVMVSRWASEDGGDGDGVGLSCRVGLGRGQCLLGVVAARSGRRRVEGQSGAGAVKTGGTAILPDVLPKLRWCFWLTAGVGGSDVSRPARVQDRGPGHQGELKCLGARPTSCLTPSHDAGSRQGGTICQRAVDGAEGGRDERRAWRASRAVHVHVLPDCERRNGRPRSTTRPETGVRTRSDAGLDPEGPSLGGF